MGTDTIKYILYSIGVFVGVMMVSFLIGYGCGQKQPTISEVKKVDTLVVHDTITQEKPFFVDRIKKEKILIPVYKTDTLWVHDTIYVWLQSEQIVWQDSLSRVYASGIMPQIDSVQHYITERIMTKEVSIHVKKPCRWGVGVHAGYGVQLGDQVRTAPYIGVGVSYNLLSW